MMTKNNSLDKLDSNYDQRNTKLLASQRKRRSKNQVTSDKSQDVPERNGLIPRILAKRKKSCETRAPPASKATPKPAVANPSSTETTTDSTSAICKEKFLDKLDLHVKPKVFSCEFCEEEFLSEHHLNLHVFRSHKDIINYKAKASNNPNIKFKSALMRDKLRRYNLLRQRYEATNTQMSKFNTRFVTRVTEERKRRRKLFREQIKTSAKNKSDETCEKISEVEDRSNQQVPTSTVEIDESLKDNAADSPTSTSDINKYKTENDRFVNKLKEFVLSNGDIIDLSNIEEADDTKGILSILANDNLTLELSSKKSGQHTVTNSIQSNSSNSDPESLKIKNSYEPEKLRTYPRKNNVKASRKNSKKQGYCDSCARSLALLDTYYETDSTGVRKIQCTFCSHKFVSINGLYRHVALYHLNCSCIRNKCHWYTPFTADTSQLDSSVARKTYHCNYCSKNYEDYKKFSFHISTFHELQPVSDELVEKTPKYLKDVDCSYLIKTWVPSACKTNFFGKKLSDGEYDEDYDICNGIDILWPIVCQKCGELYFNNADYIAHLDICYFRFDLAPVTQITEYPEESRPLEALRESSLKPETNRPVNFVVRPNIKLQFFPQDVKTKPRNPRKDHNYDLLRRTCRTCNKLFDSVKELGVHFILNHQNSANNNNNSSNNNGKVNEKDKNTSGNNKKIKTKKEYFDENNIKYYNYKNTPWYGHNVRHKWQCVHCKLSFQIFRAFSNHLFFEHNDESLIHICENCDEILTNLDQINKHLCVNVTAWKCKLCDLRFESGLEFRAHNTKTHYELFEPSVCLACGKKFLTHYMLMRHVKNKKCSSEKLIDDLIRDYSGKSKKANSNPPPSPSPPFSPLPPPPPAVEKKKENKENASNYIIVLDNDETTAEDEGKKKEVGGADGIFELVDCTGDDFMFDLDPDDHLNTIDELAEPTNELEKMADPISDETEEMTKNVPEAEEETVKESGEETTNDEDEVVDEEGFDDTPMDDESMIEDTNDEDSDDGSEDDDDEDDEDLDDEDLDDEELDDEEFDDDESFDFAETEDSKTSENNYQELIQIKDKCNKVIDLNEDTYDELEGIKNYVLENDKKSVNSAGNKRKRIDESLADKKKLTNLHDTFTAQVDELSDREKRSDNKSGGSSHKAACQLNRCSMCKLQFPSMTLLSSHFNRTHTSAVEICQLCYKMYITGNLVKHMVKDHFNSHTNIADALIATKDEISIERDTRDFIGIVGKVHLLALCKYQEPPQASSEESVDCSDCPLTFENADKYRIHNVEVHDKFCALCITKFRNGQAAAKHKLDVHGSTACYVWFASKMINAIGDTDTFKEAVGLKAKKRKPRNSDEFDSNNRTKTRSRSKNFNVHNDAIAKQEKITLKDKILDILRKSQPTVDRLNSKIQPRSPQEEDDKQGSNKSRGVRLLGKKINLVEGLELDVKTPETTTKSAMPIKNQTTLEAGKSAMNKVPIQNKKGREFPVTSLNNEASDNQSIIIKCGFLKKDGEDCNEDERQMLIVVEKNDLRKYKNNLRELAARFVASTEMSIEEMVQLLQAQLDNI